MQSLRSLLICFGEKISGIAGDVADMLFQIGIAPEDQDRLRILWFDGPGLQATLLHIVSSSPIWTEMCA